MVLETEINGLSKLFFSEENIFSSPSCVFVSNIMEFVGVKERIETAISQ